MNTINQWSFYELLECQASLHKRKVPLLKTFWRRFWVQSEGINWKLSVMSSKEPERNKRIYDQRTNKDGKLTVVGIK